jgi:hypothetical protein
VSEGSEGSGASGGSSAGSEGDSTVTTAVIDESIMIRDPMLPEIIDDGDMKGEEPYVPPSCTVQIADWVEQYDTMYAMPEVMPGEVMPVALADSAVVRDGEVTSSVEKNGDLVDDKASAGNGALTAESQAAPAPAPKDGAVGLAGSTLAAALAVVVAMA